MNDPAPLPAADLDVVRERTARVTLDRPAHWTRDALAGADLRVTGEDVVVTVRSRPSDNAIADESSALLARLPGAVDGVLVVGCDPWSGADAPARLVEYIRPDDPGDVVVSHLLLTTGRHRVDVVVERPVSALDAADDAVFAVLESVRAVGPVGSAGSTRLETFPDPQPEPDLDATPIDGAGLATLQGMAGRRWNPAVLRTPGGRTLIESGLIGRFGTVPAATAAILAPWAADAEPLTLEQHGDDGPESRLQTWWTEADATVLDGTEAEGFRIATTTPRRVVGLVAARLGIGPVWTRAFREDRVGTELIERRLAGRNGAVLPTVVGEVDPVLAAFWEAPWRVSALRRPGHPAPMTIVRAADQGFARVGRTSDGTTRLVRVSPAALYRVLVRAVR
jgi:hypothetical protein